MIFILIPILSFSQYVVPKVEISPTIDGRWEDIWRGALEIELGKKMRKVYVLSKGEELFLLVKLERSALYYVGRSVYLGISVGKGCDGFSTEILVPFKIWKGRAYIFKNRGGLRIAGFTGVGLGDYLELSLKAEGDTLCLFMLNSRNHETIERYELEFKNDGRYR